MPIGQSKLKNKMATSVDLEETARYVTSRLIWIYAVCVGISFGLLGGKGLKGEVIIFTHGRKKKHYLSHTEKYIRTCARSEDSDQPVHSRSLIRIFTRRILNSQECNILFLRTTKTLVRLRVGTGSFASSLGCHVRKYVTQVAANLGRENLPVTDPIKWLGIQTGHNTQKSKKVLQVSTILDYAK